MAFAWTTILVIVLLLPGVCFFAGLGARERTSRDLIKSTAIGEIAFALLFALVIHLIAWKILSRFDFSLAAFFLPAVFHRYTPWLPYLDFIESRLVAVSIYVLVTSASGFAAGYLGARAVEAGLLRFLAKHKWAYDLIGTGKLHLVTANVMTNTVHEHRVLMYNGRLREFFLAPDGRIAYLILTDCSRFYMYLDSDQPKTGAQIQLFGPDSEKARNRIWNYLAIDGAQIANVLFDRTSVHIDPTGQEKLEKALADDKAEELQSD